MRWLHSKWHIRVSHACHGQCFMLSTISSNHHLHRTSLLQATAAMNKQMEKSKVMEHLKEFEKANMQMDMKSEMMDELLDGVFDDEGEDAEVRE